MTATDARNKSTTGRGGARPRHKARHTRPPRPGPKPKTPKPLDLAAAAFQTFLPLINVHDPGKLCWARDDVAFEYAWRVLRTCTAAARAEYDEFVARAEAGERFDPRTKREVCRRAFGGTQTAAMFRRHIAGDEKHYYTGGQDGRSLVRLDTDAHEEHQVPDVPAAVALIDRLVPGCWSVPSDRGHAHYLKVFYGGQARKFNALCDRLQAAVGALFTAESISCDFETQGTVTVPDLLGQDGTVSTEGCRGRLAKLPIRGWTWADLKRWAALPTLTLVQFAELVGRLEGLAAAAGSSRELPDRQTGSPQARPLERDRRDHEADRFHANLRDLLAFSRRLRRVPEPEEALQHLRDHGLFTGNWEDGEDRRERRVAYILSHIERTFDPNKCGGVQKSAEAMALVGKYRAVMRRKYGESVPACVLGRVRPLATDDLGLFLGLAVWCLEHSPNRGDGGLPCRRFLRLSAALRDMGLIDHAICHDLYRACREFLDQHDILVITDRRYRSGHAMCYARGEWFPGAWRERAEKDVPPAAGQTGLDPTRRAGPGHQFRAEVGVVLRATNNTPPTTLNLCFRTIHQIKVERPRPPP